MGLNQSTESQNENVEQTIEKIQNKETFECKIYL
jgi:hypothetical protein